ncbi:Microtubules assembly and stabilization protein [Yamadazyma tenuis]|uniref:Microtubules assembly and stabilization protein n=1 Tax=Candida tenuis TaxID=2315449 RepID=UPI00279E9F3A|nr:Microtubules assembly and stabilization protein [Yamadazyma tenuis]
MSDANSNPDNKTNFSGSSDPKLDEYVKFYSQKPLSRTNSRKSSISESASTTNLTDDERSGLSKFSFLRRRSSVSSASVPTAKLPLVSVATEYNRRPLTAVPDDDGTNYSAWLPKNWEEYKTPARVGTLQPILPEFKNLKPLKRVAFHSSTFLIDPPQQIPSRCPRRGNVEVLPNGTLKCHPLSEEDRKAMEKSHQGQGGGIVVGGTGALHFLEKSDKDKADEQKHDKDREKSEKDQAAAAGLPIIDKPIVHSRVGYTVPVEKMALDLMYTRCCHLREILPIPAILKQIPKDSMAPLPILQFRNPNPTMVEIQTFSDFIRIAPILCISLDGVNLSREQFKIVLSAMSAKTQLTKLSLRNTPLDPEGWSLLCWFLSRNTVLSKLDITQCPQLTVISTKPKKKKTQKEDELVRMTCNRENRTDMDWHLFIATIIARGGIEELILTGCCITDVDVFEKLVNRALSIKTNRLGLAYNNFSPMHMQVIFNDWLFKPFVRGIDLGFNDFSATNQYLKILLELHKQPDFAKKLEHSSLMFLSINSTNLRYCDDFKTILETVFLKLPNLKYLDLSNNPKLFATPESAKDPNEAVNYFVSKLPLFPQLVRLHLETNKLSPDAIVSLANVLPFCKHIAYFSLLGNKLDLAAAASLSHAVKNSKNLCKLEADFDDLPTYFKDRVGLYSMRNMENNIYHSNGGASEDNSHNEELAQQLNEILELKAAGELDLNSDIVRDFITKAKRIRTELRSAVNSMNNLQLKQQLSLEGKETLIRLIFIDSSIGKAMQLIDDKFSSEDMLYSFDGAESRNARRPTYEGDVEVPSISNGRSSPSSKTLFPPAISRTSSKTSLNHLDKEEGNMHRISSTINLAMDQMSDMSGDQIRKKIAGIDLEQLPAVIDFVQKLKAKGVDVTSVFKEIGKKKNDENDAADNSDNEDEGIDLGYITDKLKKLQNESPPSSSEDGKDSKESVSDPAHSKSNQEDFAEHTMTSTPMSMIDSKTLDASSGKEMNELYDEMLHKLNLK